MTNPSGGLRRNEEAYRSAKSGDQMLVYQLSPAKQVVGRAHVVRGLHERTLESDTVKRITPQWDESVEYPINLERAVDSWMETAVDPIDSDPNNSEESDR